MLVAVVMCVIMLFSMFFASLAGVIDLNVGDGGGNASKNMFLFFFTNSLLSFLAL